MTPITITRKLSPRMPESKTGPTTKDMVETVVMVTEVRVVAITISKSIGEKTQAHAGGVASSM
jgi:hypothetical protein